MSNDLDFEGLSRRLLSEARDLLPRWLPGGKLKGHEYCCGSLRGEPGDSMRVNINTGKWSDFAVGDKGGDLISLYAAIQSCDQGTAFKDLSEGVDFQAPIVQAAPVVPDFIPIKPPISASSPSMIHPEYGQPAHYWEYKDSDGDTLFYVARYETDSGKQLIPWSYSPKQRWVAKGWPAPRPLYGLELLKLHPDRPILIVEGEKAADAARAIVGELYIVMTWPNGSKAVSKAEWQAIYGRKVLIWPDLDDAGEEAAVLIADILHPHCEEIKLIEAPPQNGWDAADALAEGWDWKRFKEWAKPLIKLFEPKVEYTESISKSKDPSITAVQVNIQQADPEDVGQTSIALWDQIGIARNGSGVPFFNIDNILRILEHMPEFKGSIWFDEFHQCVFTTWRTGGRTRQWIDDDNTKLQLYIQRECGLSRIGKDAIYDAVVHYGRIHSKNEPRDWFEFISWDGVPRIDEFLTLCVGTEDNDYTRAASRNFWIAMIARIYDPGCQVDNLLILEGPQGIGKSKILRALGASWHTETQESVTKNDFYLVLHGKLLVELAELATFSRSEESAIKAAISRTTDRFRAPYDRVAKDHPRQCVFIATTNGQWQGRDTTGARRFWPVECGSIDVELLKRNRTQFFAEAVHRYKAGEPWHQMPIETTLIEQEKRRQIDPWEPLIEEFLINRTQITVSEILNECIKKEKSQQSDFDEKRIVRVLRDTMRWKNLGLKSINGKKLRIWQNPLLQQLEPI